METALEIWKIITSSITTAGVVTFVITLLSETVRTKIFNILSLSLEKAKNKNRALTEKKVYVSKVRFDKEFILYQDLTEAAWTAMNQLTCARAYRKAYITDKETNKDKYFSELVKLVEKTDNATNISLKGAAFINEELFKKYQKFNVLMRQTHIIMYIEIKGDTSSCMDEGIDYRQREEKHTMIIDANYDSLTSYIMDINNSIREYLNSLDVKE